VVFATQSVFDFKMADIARAANVGKGTLYEYFTSKAELVSGCLELFVTDLERFLEGRLAGIVDPIEKIQELVRATFDFFTLKPERLKTAFDFWAAILRSEPDHSEETLKLAAYEDIVAMLSSSIADGVKLGVFKPVDTALAASMLLATLDGLLFQAALGMLRIDSGVVPERVCRIYLEGILA